MKKINKSELEQMVAQLEREFATLLKSEEPSKEEKDEKEKEQEAKETIIEQAMEEKAKEEAKKELAQEAAQEENKEEPAQEEQKEDKEEDKKDDEEIYTPEELDELKKLYESMSEKERKIHKDILEKCGEIKVQKSETSLVKSEEIEALRKENAELKKSLEELVSKFVGIIKSQPPVRKTVDVLKKGEEIGEQKDATSLSKSEIFAQLKTKVKDPSLSKKDRDAINQYLVGGQKDVNLVKHLLK
jgi:hypothetical protein